MAQSQQKTDYLNKMRESHEFQMQRAATPIKFIDIVAKAKNKTKSREKTFISHLAGNGSVKEASALNKIQQ